MLCISPLAHATTQNTVKKTKPPVSSLTAPKERTNVTRWYKAYWMNAHVGNMFVQIEEKDGLYYMTSRLEAKGMAKVTKYRNETRSVLKKTAAGYQPVEFHNKSNLRKKTRAIDLYYDAKGQLLKEAVTPADHPGKRPPVELTLKMSALDPHTVVLIAHQQIRDAVKAGKKQEIHFPIYDGRRLGDYKLIVQGKVVDEFNGKKQSAIRVTLSREAVAGFTTGELKRMKEEDPVIDLYLSDDAQMLPIKAYAKAPIGHAVAVLERECYGIDRCEETPANYKAAAYNKIRD
jgi:hypothetical protein